MLWSFGFVPTSSCVRIEYLDIKGLYLLQERKRSWNIGVRWNTRKWLNSYANYFLGVHYPQRNPPMCNLCSLSCGQLRYAGMTMFWFNSSYKLFGARVSPDPLETTQGMLANFIVSKKVKASHTRHRALGPELIPVYRQSACRWP